jgi:hypothetical protein
MEGRFQSFKGKVVGMLGASQGAQGDLRSCLAPAAEHAVLGRSKALFALGNAGDARQDGRVGQRACQSVKGVISGAVGCVALNHSCYQRVAPDRQLTMIAAQLWCLLHRALHQLSHSWHARLANLQVCVARTAGCCQLSCFFGQPRRAPRCAAGSSNLQRMIPATTVRPPRQQLTRLEVATAQSPG